MKYSNKKWFIQSRNCVATLVEPGAHSIKTRVAKCLLKWFSVESLQWIGFSFFNDQFVKIKVSLSLYFTITYFPIVSNHMFFSWAI